MRIASEVKSATENIKYYADRVGLLSKQQLNADIEQGNRIGININAGTARFDSLGAIDAACSWIRTYCNNILSNLETVEKLDKELYKEEENEDKER